MYMLDSVPHNTVLHFTLITTHFLFLSYLGSPEGSEDFPRLYFIILTCIGSSGSGVTEFKAHCFEIVQRNTALVQSSAGDQFWPLYDIVPKMVRSCSRNKRKYECFQNFNKCTCKK